MKEITKEEVKNLNIGTEYIVYNPLTNQMKVETSSPIDIAHNKHCYSELKFFVIEVEHE